MFPSFTEDQSAIREAARDFAMSVIDPGAAARDASGEFPGDILRQLGEMGFLGMTVPEPPRWTGGCATRTRSRTSSAAPR